MLYQFSKPGGASFVIGGQWGSEGKGAAVAWLTYSLDLIGKDFNICTTNASAQAGHTSSHDGKQYVVYHLPTAPLIKPGPTVYLNAGCAINPEVLMQELEDHDYLERCSGFYIHPNAAVITPDCIAAENREDSAQTAISGTRKGVGQALANKALRSGMIAKDCPQLQPYVQKLNLNRFMELGKSVLVEVPQGVGLSFHGPFYPFCTSRDCSIPQAMADAGIHPAFMNKTMLVLRALPIRVGSLPGHSSGGHYSDQQELTWEQLGLTPEMTTVTKRERRVFSWSDQQVSEAMAATRPDIVFLTHCDYLTEPNAIGCLNYIKSLARRMGLETSIAVANGPTTADVKKWEA